MVGEDMPLIRRSAVTFLAEIVQNLYSMDCELDEKDAEAFTKMNHLITSENAFLVYIKIFPAIDRLINDDQDMVRVLLLSELYKVLEIVYDKFTIEGQKILILPMVQCMLNDHSWKVRSMFAEEIIKVIFFRPFST